MTATTTSDARLRLLAQLGAEGVVMDGLDAMSVGEAVARATPDACGLLVYLVAGAIF